MNNGTDFNSKIDMNKHEMKADEIVDAFRAGKGALSQMKEMPDGTKRFFNVYGDVHDGWDHILNIFMDSTCIGPLLGAAIHGKLKTPEKKKESTFKGSETTIDYTDKAITWLLRNTDEEVYLEAYQRDEKKGFYEPAIEVEYAKKDGLLEITAEKLQEDQKLAYVLIFISLRNHLEAEGFVDKLREINKYSGAGILVTATDEDHITAKVVQGKSRPDLPCEMFLMGTITCRPYLDEMIAGSQISGMTIEERIKAAENGDQDAMESLANSYLNGNETEQDFRKSFKWWKKLAEEGSAIAQFNTGLYLAKGLGVKRDFGKAVEWMEKAAENGDEDAARHLELYKPAEDNWRKANSGDAAAQAEIAKLFMILGKSVDQSDSNAEFKVAYEFSKKAADQGNPEGLYLLGLCYEYGRGVESDTKKAAEAYKKAADQGHAPSQWNLACFYMNGIYGAVEQNGPYGIWNELEGLMLAYKSADQGYELAINGLERRGDTVEQIIEYYASEDNNFMLEGTQYLGRADRCESIHPGDELTYKFVKDNHGLECMEFFFKGGSVGLMYQYRAAKLMALLKLNRAKLKVTVRSIIPKSKRGKRARNAEVTLNLILTEIKPETSEEKLARLEREKKERETQQKALEEKRKAEEEARRKAEAEIKAKAEAEQKAWEEEAARIKATRKEVLEKKLSSIEEDRKKRLDAAAEEKNRSLSSCEEEIANAEKAGSDMEKELASLGFFSFSKKNSLKKAILENEDKKTQLADKKEAILKKYEERISEIKKEADLNAQNAKTVIDMQYPIPESPAERERKRIEKQEAEKKRKEEERARKEYIKNLRGEEAKVYDVLCTYGSMPASMVANEIDLTIQRTSAYLKRLVDAGIVEKTVKNGKVWFDIK